MDLLFASNSWFNWEAEKEFSRLVNENPQVVQAAKRRLSALDPEIGRDELGSSNLPGEISRRSIVEDSPDEKILDSAI